MLLIIVVINNVSVNCIGIIVVVNNSVFLSEMGNFQWLVILVKFLSENLELVENVCLDIRKNG